MQRTYEAYLKDILEAIRKIEKYTQNMSYEDFLKDELIQDGVLKNLEVIGEAVKNIPDEIKHKKQDIEWKKIAGLRDILTHEYFGINFEIVWDVTTNKLPDLKNNTQALLFEMKIGR
ncbi:MAG: DUF86 domain-containing protein [Candidatus Methanoperedens sp.]|nr:DUF86 domain-containing protein [Candidatus Methanoperedens sp.]MCZ7370130.1 DUF86 domain-containing protein [Candidatus Methanoperedens sp.]